MQYSFQSSIIELKEAFSSHKFNRSPGLDEISTKIIRCCFGELATPLKHNFDLSLSQSVFHDKLKIAKVTPIYKNDEKTILRNYRPFSVFLCFSKILERLMCNRMYGKQFGFCK